MENCTPVDHCLACGSSNLALALNLGNQPLANNFRAKQTDHETEYPLAVNRCSDCNHLQLTHIVDPSVIYTHYLYVSGTSATYRNYMDWYAEFVREQMTYWPTTVLDIGCNDGSQLTKFKELGFDTYGVDPAENLYPTSSKDHSVICGFWNQDTAKKLGRKFDVITSQNAFSHIPDPVSYLKLAKEYLREEGRLFISTSQADMVLNGEFDTIYHEHISFYNAESMRRLAERAGLYLVDVVKTPIHGTSYIFVLSHTRHNARKMSNTLTMESIAGLQSPETYNNWSVGVKLLLSTLTNKLENYRTMGYKLVGYGAAAKGMTLLNAADLMLDAVIDDNPLKQGTWCPGMDIPVVGIDYLDQFTNEDRIVFVPLAWNFYNEIRNKILEKRNNNNDRFAKYYPAVVIE